MCVLYIAIYLQARVPERDHRVPKKVPQMDRRSMGGAEPPPSVGPRLLISYKVLFSTGDDMEPSRTPGGNPLPSPEHGLGQEIPVQYKQGATDVLRSTGAVTEHLYHMGDELIPEPVADGLIPIMNLDGQWQAEDLYSISN